MNKLLYLLILGALAVSCGEKPETEQENVNKILPEEKAEVEVTELKKSIFSKELISNGKLSAVKKSDIRTSLNENIVAIYVKNGDYIQKGQKVLSFDSEKLQARLANAQSSLEQAFLSLQDAMISRGYQIKDTARIPEDEMKLLKTKSGYDKAVVDKKLAELELKNATVCAPFSGLVANLFCKLYNTPSSSEPLCTIIGSDELEVDFYVLEGELGMISSGAKADVLPFVGAEKTYSAIINRINPMVDKNGLVRVTATLNGQVTDLYDGLNVKVAIKNSIADQLVVPKGAVVLRSAGRNVVFTLSDGKAMWNYVEVGQANSDQVQILSGLKEGDKIIFSGNSNLAHEASVKVKN